MEGYKKKYMLLLISSPIILMIVYRLAISGTFSLSGDIDRLSMDIKKSCMAPANIGQLSRELAYLKKRIGGTSEIRGEQSLFTHIADYCKKHGLSLKSFPAAHKLKTREYSCNTSVVCIEGSFKKLLKLMHYFEHKKHKLIRSASFDMVRDRHSRTDKLQLKIYIQSIDYGKD